MHILLVEDDREAVAFLGRRLEKQGHVADRATTGGDGRHLCDRHPSLRVVLDLAPDGGD